MKNYEINGVEYPFNAACSMVFHRILSMLKRNANEEEIKTYNTILNKMLLSEDLTEEDSKFIEKMDEKYNQRG
ncbi:MAG: hypothetical protein J6Y02_21550 [Pseudobutyrivibrio sp.]|nr:hypothetical protein [Pseudobutyrivibrio sp.]